VTTAEVVEFQPRELAPVSPPDTDSWTAVVADVAKLAGHIADTEFVPKGLRGSAAAVAAAILFGREVGLPPMTALTQVYVLDGRPAMYAEAMRALVLAAGHDLEVRNATGATATLAGRRRGTGRWQEVTWNLDMARAAGLVRAKSNWETNPRAMLVARATTELCRQLFPDVIHGFRAVEELADETDTTTTTTTEPPSRQRVTVRRQKPQDAATDVAATQPRGTTRGPTRQRGGDPTASAGVVASTPAGPPLPGEPGYDTPISSPPPGEDASAPPDDEPAPPGSGADEVTTPDGGAEAPDEPPAGDPTSPPAGPGDIEVVDDPNPKLPRNYRTKVIVEFGRLGVTAREHRLAYCSILVGRPITTSNDLTRQEAHSILETLALCGTRDALDQVADAPPKPTEPNRETLL
jgi:hypothetical protein